MNPSIIRFHHFRSKESYCKLQEIFASYDDRRQYDVIDEPMSNFEITYYERDELFGKNNYKQLSYLMDFLLPGIRNLKNLYFDNFKEATYDKGLFSSELLDGFAKFHRNKLVETGDNIDKAKYIPPVIRKNLVRAINELQALIDDFVQNPYPKVKTKIQFNWLRTDVEYFFYLLRTNKEISWISDGDLGKIIDAVFQCKKGSEIKDITGSRKHLGHFENDLGRSENKANERLKAVFQKSDFFNN